MPLIDVLHNEANAIIVKRGKRRGGGAKKGVSVQHGALAGSLAAFPALSSQNSISISIHIAMSFATFPSLQLSTAMRVAY